MQTISGSPEKSHLKIKEFNMYGKHMIMIRFMLILMVGTPILVFGNNGDVTSADLAGPDDQRAVDSSGQAEEEKRSESEKTGLSQQKSNIIEYFEKTKSEILDGRKYNDQSTPANALLTLISAYYHQDKNVLEQIFPIVKQKQFERLSSPEVREQMLAAARNSILSRIEIEDKAPEESDLCAIYTRQSPEKPIDQIWSFAYVDGAWRFAGSTSSTDNWKTQAKKAEAMTRDILQSEAENTGTSAIKSEGKGEITQAVEKQSLKKLIAWWRLDEADGNDVADSSGNGNTGRLAGNPQWRPAGGKIGGALEFDGYGDYVQIGNESAFDIPGPITVAAWFKVNSFDKRWQALITKGDTSWRLQRFAEDNTLAFHCTGIASVTSQRPEGIEGEKNVNDGQWHHAVGVYDGLNVSLYVDGELDNSSKASGTIQANDSAVIIGGNSEQADREWNGMIDEVCIIAGSIDADAVHALYTGADPNMIAQKANPHLQGSGKLVAWWRFENDANDSAWSNDGTTHGNPIYLDGKFGRAICFDGNDYVDCGNPVSLNFGTGDWTISAWIKTTQTGIDQQGDALLNRGTVIANGGDEAGGIRYALAVNEGQLGSITLTTDNDMSKVQAVSRTAVNDGAWHHVVGMRNAGQLRLYVDGTFDGGNYLSEGYDLSGTSQHNAYIGVITDHRDNSLYKYFVGVVDEVCIFNGAIDANGISALYSGEDPMKVANTSIIARAGRTAAQSRAPASSPHQGIEGDWEVSTSPAIIQIRRKSDGALEATAVPESQDVASPPIPLEDVNFENGTLRFKVTSQQAVFNGTMKEDGLTIEGQLSQQGQIQQVILKRIVVAPSKAVPVAMEQLQGQTTSARGMATVLILVLTLAGVVGGIVFFLVRSSIR